MSQISYSCLSTRTSRIYSPHSNAISTFSLSLTITMSVQSVLGPISASDLGVTLTHEHLDLSIGELFVQPHATLQSYIDGKLTLENIGFVRQYFTPTVVTTTSTSEILKHEKRFRMMLPFSRSSVAVPLWKIHLMASSKVMSSCTTSVREPESM